jgi:hypothetical protein
MFENWQGCTTVCGGGRGGRKEEKKRKKRKERERESENKERQMRDVSIPPFFEKNESCSLSFADRGERE